ncbi:HNH endonuclease [Brevibacterium sanguinis]|uniref:HNH endonuclease n=2 Tax=Brevibacterium TaxID=1696 RepID=A0A366IHG8_9MICO|nr:MULTISPECIES: HNH endonuclease [Brevibacterium]RBP63177.1 HNH endonuclease [Brevibacterium sanguinis]RBP69647.1 HNH endonuclease [Brevibacterium celere]
MDADPTWPAPEPAVPSAAGSAGSPSAGYSADSAAPADSGALADAAALKGLLRDLPPARTEKDALARITAFEELKAALAAAQSREAVAFERLRIDRDAMNGVPAAKRGIRAGDEIGLARRTSPGSGRTFLSTARTLVGLPLTFDALRAGVISEAKAKVIVDEVADLAPAERRKLDVRMRNSLPDAGVRSLRHEARALAAELSSEDAAERAARAAAERRVTVTALPHGMGRICATIPMVRAVAVAEALRSGADSALARGVAEGRRHAQIMADLLVERVTGQERAEDVPLEVNVVIETSSLIDDGDVPAWLPGYGPWPAKEARNFIAGNRAKVFYRRLFTTPREGQLVGMESKRRVFSGLLRRMIVFRDDVCRTPWCDAPIKHADHIDPAAAGGSTSWENSSGLCASCNFAKEHPGWRHEVTEDGLVVHTPAGRRYTAVKRPLVTKMVVPRRSSGSPPGRLDWRQRLIGFMSPRAEPPPGSRDSPRVSRVSAVSSVPENRSSEPDPPHVGRGDDRSRARRRVRAEQSDLVDSPTEVLPKADEGLAKVEEYGGIETAFRSAVLAGAG